MFSSTAVQLRTVRRLAVAATAVGALAFAGPAVASIQVGGGSPGQVEKASLAYVDWDDINDYVSIYVDDKSTPSRDDDIITFASGNQLTPVNGCWSHDIYTVKCYGAKFDEIRIYGNGGHDTFRAMFTAQWPLKVWAGAGFDDVEGSPYGDEIHGGPGPDWIYGKGGRDRLYADGGGGVLDGGANNDHLYSSQATAEEDNCGTGIDKVVASAGDTLTGCEKIFGTYAQWLKGAGKFIKFGS
jgi:Ca2+-binding RTX toxin-like protein